MDTREFFAMLEAHAARRGGVPAVIDAQRAWTYRELLDRVEQCARALQQRGVRVLASQLDNGMSWIVADLAALRAGIVHVPLPAFFTAAQMQHVLDASGADALLMSRSVVAADVAQGVDCAAERPAEALLPRAGLDLALQRRAGRVVPMPEGTLKLSFTSGTTGTPKGVCLDAGAMLAVARSVADATGSLEIERHLCALPYALLLENIAGLLAPLWRGASVIALPMAMIGLRGAAAFDPARLDEVCRRHRAQSVILLPQMLRAWCAGLMSAGRGAPLALRLAAVGGAAVGSRLLTRARAAGIPACEGYGLTEGGSVQTLNLPPNSQPNSQPNLSANLSTNLLGADRPGSAGRPLPHARLRIAADGEVEIAGSLFLGYLGAAPRDGIWWPTGDLGKIDADGTLHLRGRKKNVLITAFGRNVSPEWIETLLHNQPPIAQAVVCGEGQPALSAVIWPVSQDTTRRSCAGADGLVIDHTDDRAIEHAIDHAIEQAIEHVNRQLPDYARIGHWVRATVPFSSESGMATANGRPLRVAIERHHQHLLYAENRTGETMESFDRMLAQTRQARESLIAAPIIQACLRGEVALGSYIAFLTQAYHHVRHTVPLLHACRDALPERLGWLRAALDEYIVEETGHDAWILDDLAACGLNPATVRTQHPAPATRRMVEHAYALIESGQPIGFLGMVHVLEGTSVALALQAADRIQAGLNLPDRAFSYLRSHGTLDHAHTAHFRELVNRLDDPRDMQTVIAAARDFYRLYGDIFRSLPMPLSAQTATAQATATSTAGLQ